VAFGDAGINAILIIRSIAGERGQRTRDLVTQGADLGERAREGGTVVHIFVGLRRSHDLTGVGVDAEVQRLPRPPPAGAVFFNQPLTGTAQL